MKFLQTILFAICISFFYACGGDGDEHTHSHEGDGHDNDHGGSMSKDGLTLTPLTDSPAYPDAALTLSSATASDGGYTFDFEVANYELGAQTANAGSNGLANSGKGQHIHFIVDNGPYSAHYEADFTKELADGKHVILAFLSRSYHESVKNASSYVVTQLGEGEELDLSGPHMFYSRPKGTYKGADTEKLMLDFFLLNCDLSSEGYKVRATINGTTFEIDTWQPYVVEGLEKGEVTVKLELINEDGFAVESPFNPVERTVTLAEADPQ